VGWPVISALILPPLLWQISVRLSVARFVFRWGALVSWLISTILIGLVLVFGAKILIPRAILLALLSSSLVWQVRERSTGNTELGTFGQLTLALLLVESDVSLSQSRSIISGVISGVGIGLFMGILGVRKAFRFEAGNSCNIFCLVFMYLAYLIGIVVETSAVATTLMTGSFIAIYGFNVRLWPKPVDIPAPLARKGIFFLVATAWLLMGWLEHVDLKVTHGSGIVLSLLATAVGTVLAQRLDPIQSGQEQSILKRLLQKETKAFLLIAGTLLLWPLEARINFETILVAVVSTILTIALLQIIIYPLFVLAVVSSFLCTFEPLLQDQLDGSYL
jgi:hypothetical protein